MSPLFSRESRTENIHKNNSDYNILYNGADIVQSTITEEEKTNPFTHTNHSFSLSPSLITVSLSES